MMVSEALSAFDWVTFVIAVLGLGTALATLVFSVRSFRHSGAVLQVDTPIFLKKLTDDRAGYLWDASVTVRNIGRLAIEIKGYDLEVTTKTRVMNFWSSGVVTWSARDDLSIVAFNVPLGPPDDGVVSAAKQRLDWWEKATLPTTLPAGHSLSWRVALVAKVGAYQGADEAVEPGASVTAAIVDGTGSRVRSTPVLLDNWIFWSERAKSLREPGTDPIS